MRTLAALTPLIPLLLLCAAALSGCGAGASLADNSYTQTGFYFDTIISVTIYGKDDNEAAALAAGCFDIADEAEKRYSNTKPGSEVSRINAAGGEAVAVSESTAELIKRGLYYSELCGGAFSLTVGALTDLWDFSDTTGTPPDAADIAAAVTTINDSLVTVSLDDGSPAVSLGSPDARLDLGGIAKGAIADAMSEYLLSHGADSALINLGGNVELVGAHPDGSDFIVGIQEPFAANGTALVTVAAADISIVTSGTYQRYFEYDGRLYHHILDTETGYPAETGLSSVTVLGDSSTDCDALSTTCFLLGEADARELIESLDGYEAIFINTSNEVSCTSGLSIEGDRLSFNHSLESDGF